jgi:hypothetical protein
MRSGIACYFNCAVTTAQCGELLNGINSVVFLIFAVLLQTLVGILFVTIVTVLNF